MDDPIKTLGRLGVVEEVDEEGVEDGMLPLLDPKNGQEMIGPTWKGTASAAVWPWELPLPLFAWPISLENGNPPAELRSWAVEGDA